MGCDIHVHVEVKIKGKWEHYSCPIVSRNYRLFSVLAGVRGKSTDSFAPRGLPEDLSVVTAISAAGWGLDGHTHSYLMASDLADLLAKLAMAGIEGDLEWDILRCYLFGHSLDCHIRYPQEMQLIVKHGFEDLRIVFWFDN